MLTIIISYCSPTCFYVYTSSSGSFFYVC